MNLNKQQHRQLILKQLQANDYHAFDILIEQQLCQLLQTINIDNEYLGLYLNLLSEPYLDYHKFQLNYNLALPKIITHHMAYIAYQHDLALVKNNLGIKEPLTNTPIVIPRIIILPGLAFNLNGYRLGRGKGFFDQYINKHAQHNIILIGICYAWQINCKIDFELHDRPVNYIITEQQIIKIP